MMGGRNMGVVNVTASTSGVITEVQQQSGGYVTESVSIVFHRQYRQRGVRSG